MNENENRHRGSGIVGTVLFHLILILILCYSHLRAVPVEEEALLVDYSQPVAGGGGGGAPAAASAPTPVESPAPAAPKQSNLYDGQTKEVQDFEEAAGMDEAKKREQEKARAKEAADKAAAEARAKAEAEAKAKAEAEAKAKAEAEARAKAEAEAKAKAQKTANAKNAINAFGKPGPGSANTSDSGSGQGDRIGSGTGNGNGSGSISSTSWALNGRSLVGNLPKPTYNSQETGTVVVEITVDKTGAVVAAKVISKGTTVQSSYLWAQAESAAKKAKFNADAKANALQKGTITYHFTLK